MNKFTSIIFCLTFLVASKIHAQFGETLLPGISYQALIIEPEESLPGYNNLDAPMSDQAVCLQFSIVTGSGAIAYQEFQGTETDSFGMINTIIGRGNINIGSWNDIDWNDLPVYLKAEINLKGQCYNYYLLSYEELTAVPFALNAQNQASVGESVFDIWIAEGNTGTEIDFFLSLSGETGATGLSAYEEWLNIGNEGTESDFLLSLSGETGATGLSAYEEWLNIGNEGTEEDFLGSIGFDGVIGKSAYQIWLELGNEGTPEDFINSLQGINGVSAYKTWLDLGNTGTKEQFIDSLQGEDGDDVSLNHPDGESSGDILTWVWNETTWIKQIVSGNSSSMQLLTSINSSNQIKCEFSTIDTIKYALSGTSTSVTVNGLPTGITSRISNDTLYIEGTSSTDFSQQTRYLYTVQSLGGEDQTSGSFTFNPSATATLTSGNLTQSSCLGQDISPIVLTLSGAVPNANVTGLPTGLIASISGNSLTISGTPSSTIANGSTYPFSIQSLAETCDPVTVQGSISFSDCSSCFPNGFAGNDATVCSGGAIFNLGSNASNYSSLNWTTSGSGSFNDSTSTAPEYLPSSADFSSGSVVLTLTAQNTSCITPQTIQSSITLAVVDCNSISATIVNQDKCIVFGNDLTFGASIVTANIGSILAGGICFNTSGVPTVLDTKVEISNNSSGDWAASPPSFEATLINVPINSALYVRAYVETINGDIIYGEQIDVISENPNLNHIFNFSEVSGLFNINDYPVTTTSEITFKKIEKLTGINWDSSNIVSRNIERVNFPLLDTINSYPGIIIRNEYSIKTIFAPLLKKVFWDINIDNTSLETILLPEVQEVNLLNLNRNQSLDSINFNKLSKTTHTNNSTQYPRYYGINIFNNASINTLKFPSLKTTELFYLSNNNSLRLIESDSLINVDHYFIVSSNAQLVSIKAPQLFETGKSGQVAPSFNLYGNSILEAVSIPSLRKVYDGIAIGSNNLLDTSTQFPCEMYVFFNDSFDCKPAATMSVYSNLNNIYCFQDLSLRGQTTLVTVPVSNVTSIAAESAIQITLGSNSYVKQEQRGLVWSTSANPILDGSDAIDPFSSTNGNGNDDEVAYLYNLTPGTTYYYRVYAKDCNSTFYGNELSFTTPIN